MPSGDPDLRRLLAVLTRHGVEFVVIGGVAGTLHGSPLVTYDLDVVHRRSPENVARLLAALEELDAYYRYQGGRRLVPGPTHLESPGHQLLRTNAGRLDLLGEVVGRGYDDLLAESEAVDIEEMTVHVVRLETLIELKELAGRDRDRWALSTLRALLRERGGEG